MLESIHYDEGKTKYLVQGFKQGFCIGHKGTLAKGNPKNHRIVAQYPHVIAHKLKELCQGRIAGPFKTKPVKNFINNPLGLVPKTTESGDCLLELYPGVPSSYHMITDLKKSGVNATIPKDCSSVKYVKFDRIIEHCIRKGPGCCLARTDILSAFSLWTTTCWA